MWFKVALRPGFSRPFLFGFEESTIVDRNGIGQGKDHSFNIGSCDRIVRVSVQIFTDNGQLNG
jgi:hypothetical protein